MICSRCLTPALAGSAFCTECGTALEVVCRACGADNPLSARFCRVCGGALAEAAAPAIRSPAAYTPRYLTEKILTSRAALEGQRKQVTVMFADVKGSQALARKVDAEVWHQILDRYFEILTGGVHRFEGTINQYTGDGVMAIFGAPIAHEDHAQRACFAALALRDELAVFSAELRRSEGLDFSVRMGLNSGEVVVGRIGDDLRMDYTAQGHTVGLAARMEALAAPGSIYLTKATARLVAGFFDLKNLGRFSVKGEPHGLRVHELRGVGRLRTRFEVARERGLSPFVGREAEMRFLEESLARAVSGEGHGVGIVSEAGLGKSRLCWEFSERCRQRGIPVLYAVGLSQARSIALLPIVDLLRGYFDVRDGEGGEAIRERIAAEIQLADESLRETLPRVFELLQVGDPQQPARRVDPEIRQRELVRLVVDLVRSRSVREPLLIVVEDLQWFDGASAMVIQGLLAELGGTRTLVALSGRPGSLTQFRGSPGYRELVLEPLSREATQVLVERLIGDHPSVARLASQIAERSEGHVFFVEEMIRAMVAARMLQGDEGEYRDGGAAGEPSLPASVHALLDSRIDALPEREKQVLQAAAVLGRDFAATVLERVVELPPAETDAALEALCDAGLLARSGEGALEVRSFGRALVGLVGRLAGVEARAERLYTFRHALLQEVAYGSQLSQHRGRIHRDVARVLEGLDPARADERAGVIAHHLERSGDSLGAARWYARAARWRGAEDPTESFRWWQRVRALCREVEESPESIALVIRAGTQVLNLSWRIGVPEDEVEAIFAETRAAAERSGRADAIAGAVGTFGIVRGMAGHVREALSHIDEATRLAASSGRTGLEIALLAALAYLQASTGELEKALAMADRGVEAGHGDLDLGSDLAALRPVLFLTALRGFILTHLGRLEEAAGALAQATALSDPDRDAEIAGWVGGWRVLHARATGEQDGVIEEARRALETAERSASPFSQVVARAYLGRAYALRSEWPEAVADLERSLELARARRTGLETEAGILADLAEASLEVGNAKRALQLANEAVEVARHRHLALDECVAGRVLARVLLETSRGSKRRAARKALERSLDIAREIGARALEPGIHLGLAETARLAGDETERAAELSASLALYREIGADAHAARVETALEGAGKAGGEPMGG
jgi:class 3 adenylate cyclase/tetratricopeptide (TPR) repeat protein